MRKIMVLDFPAPYPSALPMSQEETPKGSGEPPAARVDYDRVRSAFSWDVVRRELENLSAQTLNIAHVAVDRHVLAGRGARVAIRWLGEAAPDRMITYRELYQDSNRFANVIESLGARKVDRIFLILGRIPELFSSTIGIWKNSSVCSTLPSTFGPAPIQARLNLGIAKILVTTPEIYEHKLKGIKDRVPSLEHIIIIGEDGGPTSIPGTLDYRRLMDKASPEFTLRPVKPSDMALLHFTSGTTGLPKGAIHVHDAVVSLYATTRYVLDLHPGDVYWCTADPGLITGTSYGIVAPLIHGATMVVDEGGYDLGRWYSIIQQQSVNVWYTSPTAIRRMMKMGTRLPKHYNFSSLRLIASAGEPLSSVAVEWTKQVFGRPAHDTWWQTETGAIMIANSPAMEIHPGSIGLPVPGVDVELVRRLDDGKIEIVNQSNEEGEIAVKQGWPSMFRGYLNDGGRYAKCFCDGYYLSGDLAKRDDDGYYWFVGRADDVIKSSGHLIGPFEVESVLLEHPAVAEAGVIGKPDEIAGNIVKAFVSLRDGFVDSGQLREDIYDFARKRLGVVAPKEIEVLDSLPKTKSGRIMRRLLKAHEFGLPQGDTSTLEEGRS